MSLMHTVVPLEVVLAGLGGAGGSGGAGLPPEFAAPGEGLAALVPNLGLAPVRTVALGGGRFLELAAGPGGEVVRRLHSPDPSDYLLPAFQPGARYRDPG